VRIAWAYLLLYKLNWIESVMDFLYSGYGPAQDFYTRVMGLTHSVQAQPYKKSTGRRHIPLPIQER